MTRSARCSRGLSSEEELNLGSRPLHSRAATAGRCLRPAWLYIVAVYIAFFCAKRCCVKALLMPKRDSHIGSRWTKIVAIAAQLRNCFERANGRTPIYRSSMYIHALHTVVACIGIYIYALPPQRREFEKTIWPKAAYSAELSEGRLLQMLAVLRIVATVIHRPIRFERMILYTASITRFRGYMYTALLAIIDKLLLYFSSI